MCERILYLKSALHVLEASNDIPIDKRLSEVDWEQLKSVTKVLKPSTLHRSVVWMIIS
jgi:hypothetical protein